MPETTMNEYRQPMSGKDKIRSSWKILAIQTEAKSHPVRDTTDYKLRSSITSPDPGHVLAASLSAYGIYHQLMILNCGPNELQSISVNISTRLSHRWYGNRSPYLLADLPLRG